MVCFCLIGGKDKFRYDSLKKKDRFRYRRSHGTFWSHLDHVVYHTGLVVSNVVFQVNSFSISTAVGMDDLFETFYEIIQRSCHSTCTAWLEKEFFLLKGNADKVFIYFWDFFRICCYAADMLLGCYVVMLFLNLYSIF